jgi:hypothetical protein
MHAPESVQSKSVAQELAAPAKVEAMAAASRKIGSILVRPSCRRAMRRLHGACARSACSMQLQRVDLVGTQALWSGAGPSTARG